MRYSPFLLIREGSNMAQNTTIRATLRTITSLCSPGHALFAFRLAGLLVAASVAAGAPAQSNYANSASGNPCFKNNGNPCNGNNGNLGRQGNANGERRTIDRKPPPIVMALPAVNGRAAFIDQIGSGSTAAIVQTAPNAYAKIVQNGGPNNEVDIAQRGMGIGYASIGQVGSRLFARAEQDGSGSNALWVAQSGTNNWLWSRQSANGSQFNGAALSQIGNNNDMLLLQAGSDNRAVLNQEGDNNGMSVAQNGVGNRLTWSQQGNYLSDLQIVQNGGTVPGGQLLITQTNR